MCAHQRKGAPFTVYFYGEFSEPPKSARTFHGVNSEPLRFFQGFSRGKIGKPIWGTSGSEKSGPMNDRVGALFSWNSVSEAQVSSRVGISFISTDKARSYIKAEIPSWKLQDAVESTVQEWNEDVLSLVRVPLDRTANLTNVRVLYSSLYFTHLMPSDRTGENPLWESEEPYWDDFFTFCK